MTDKKIKDNTEKKSFWDHLEDMRGMLLRSVLVICALTIIAFVLKKFLFDNIILPPKESSFITNRVLCEIGKLISIDSLCLASKTLNIININLPGQFVMHVYISFMIALIFAAPYIIWEIWRFIKPALYNYEQKKIKGGILFCIILFFTGVLFSYFIIVPLTINFFTSYSLSETIKNQITLNSYVNTLFSVTITTGALFELPLFVFILTKLGLITPSFLKKNRKYALVIVLIIAAIITPPDVFSQILVSLPLLVLYEITIMASKRAISTNNKLQG
ncbi:MAG TPA: twin-arginine translocase subunit TatC [Bacteroidales bacterium]|nr:twin-arginine translocase subunit TatC [Bacteroidales bacterium]